MNRYLAIDIGASSLRGILGWLEDGVLKTQEVWRQANGALWRNGHLCWDLEGLYDGMLCALKACRDLGQVPDTMGIDTWAVDYVLLDERDEILGDSVAYRDKRTEGMDRKLEQRLPFSRHYEITGIARQPFNTVYQLMAQFAEHPDHRTRARSFLMIPDYLGFRLTGVKKNEYTNASSTALLDADTRTWSPEVLTAADLPQALFSVPPELPGTKLGTLRGELVRELGFDVTVVLPATHDTGSAYVAVPARDAQTVILSSGTWSLLGVELDGPNTTREARLAGFTNEGGALGNIRFLKNIMGLWMLQCVQKELSAPLSFAEMAELADRAQSYPGRVDVTDNRFLAPANMTREITKALAEQGLPEPTLPELLSCVTHSLAQSYARAIGDLERMLGQTYTSLCIVGGGSQNRVLNRWTAEACGLPVYAGPGEGTAIGNVMMQMLSAAELPDLSRARTILNRSFAIEEVLP